MASNTVVPLDYDMIDLSEDDRLAAQKYLNENGVRGIEGFLAERLEAWRKWSVICARIGDILQALSSIVVR